MSALLEKSNSNWTRYLFIFFVFLFSIGPLAIIVRSDEYQIHNNIGFLVLCLSLIAFYLVAIWQNKTTRVNIATITISVVISLYIAEAAIVYFIPDLNQSDKKSRIHAMSDLGLEFDKRTRFEVIAENKQKGVESYPAMSPIPWFRKNGFDALDGRLYPLAGFSNKNIVHCNESGYWVTHRSDRIGFNNPDSVHNKSVDAVVIGDSFAKGTCVDQGSDIAGVMRNISKKNVINLGIGGTGPYAHLAVLTEYAAQYKPKDVYWVYYERNDLGDLLLEERFDFIVSYLNDGHTQNLAHRQIEIDKVLDKYYSEVLENRIKRTKRNDSKNKRILNLRNIAILTGLKPKQYPDRSSLLSLRKILEVAKTRVNKWGGKLYFVYLTTWERYASNWDEAQYYKKDVLEITKELDIATIDFDVVAEAEKDPKLLYPFGINGHLNEEGYKKLAHYIMSSSWSESHINVSK